MSEWERIGIADFGSWKRADVLQPDGTLKRRWLAGVMRRKRHDGSFEYREMNQKELDEFAIDTADNAI